MLGLGAIQWRLLPVALVAVWIAAQPAQCTFIIERGGLKVRVWGG
jgi:hypothetical protein